jgi:CRISPR system Cascade subunit CasD
MGIRRDEDERLLALAKDARVHVRVDVAGVLLVDDQTIQGHPVASETRQTIQSKRTYLCDASFAVVVVPGHGCSTEAIAAALRVPHFAPYLGRRACAPSSALLLAERVEAKDPVGLFHGLERGPSDLLAALGLDSRTDSLDLYLDATDHPKALRRLPLRDQLAGPLRRQWRERMAVHIRTGLPGGDV